MQEHVITKEQVDWNVVKTKATNMLGDEPTIDSRDKAIYFLLKTVKTNHSFYQFKESGKVIRHADFSCRVGMNDNYELPEDIGYVRVDSFTGINPNETQKFAESIQAQIIEQDSKSIKGWVVDLRRNSGGNMWPMLAGVSALLKDGIRGHFVKPNGETTSWGVDKGASFLNNRFLVKLKEAYELKNKNKPMAVLSSKRTSSSGEAVLIGFKETRQVRFIGENSCGLATANRRFSLDNGDALLVTVSVMTDRAGNQYPTGIEVDELSETPLQAAADWIYAEFN